MASIREQLIAAAVTALNTSRPVGVPQFVRARTYSIKPDQLPSADVFPVDDTPNIGPSPNAPIYERRLVLRVASIGKDGDGKTADQAIDPALVWAEKTLNESTLGGLALSVRPIKTTFEYEDVDAFVCRASSDFLVIYVTRRTDPESKV